MEPLTQIDGDLIHHWYILALESEVPAAKPLKAGLYDTPYVLFRDSRGAIAVLVDRCIHRGAQLSLGKIENGEIRCPYHGWKYNSKGHVTEVPSNGPPACGLDAGAGAVRLNCARQIPTVVQDGCVWIWPGDPKLKTATPPWRFPNHGDPKTVQYFMRTDFENEVTDLVQNFMDVPHTVFVHAKWFRNRSLLKVPVKIAVGNSCVKVIYDQPNDSIGFTERVLNPKREPMLHTDEFIFPNLTRVDYQFGKHFFIINSQCSPISRYQTRVYTWIAYDVGMVSRWLEPFIRFYTRKVITQDVEIMKNHGDNLRHFENHPGADAFLSKSTPADELHLAISRLRDLGKADRHSPQTVEFSKEREFWI